MIEKRTNYFPGVIFLLLMLCLNSHAVIAAEETEKIKRPDFQSVDMNGEIRNASEWDGKILVLVFGASWAAPVHAIIKMLIDLQEKYIDHGVHFVYFSINDSEGTMSDFLKEYELNFPMILTGGENVAGLYKVIAVPNVIFIDRQGYIRNKVVGAFHTDDKIETIIRDLL
jgi:thiol-disulfide isomerase/thioredoxin